MVTVPDYRQLACSLTAENLLTISYLNSAYLECGEVHILTHLYSSVLLPSKIKEDFTSGETNETSNSLTKNSQNPPSCSLSAGGLSAAGWDDEDDAFLLEAAEDAEFADAADKSLCSSMDIPDELIIEALQNS